MYCYLRKIFRLANLSLIFFTWVPKSSFSLIDLFLNLASIFIAASACVVWTIIQNTEDTHHVMWILDKVWNQVTFSLALYSLSEANVASNSSSSVGNLYTVPYIIQYLDVRNKTITFCSLPPLVRSLPHYLWQHQSSARHIVDRNST